VEDNEVAREELAFVLRREGYAVDVVADGRAALERLRGGPAPGLILLDMMTPRLDGWRFLEQRGTDPALAAVPVVILTALGVASAEWAASLGAAHCLRKPWDTDSLLRTVRRFFGTARTGPAGPAARD
jgi:CheY-like chemotaxis protein